MNQDGLAGAGPAPDGASGSFFIRLPRRELARRLPRVVLGLALFGLGIASMILGDLGLGPWDVFHQGLSDLIGIGIGTIILLVGILILLAMIPLREPLGLGTVLNAVLIGATVDLVLAVAEPPRTMAARLVLMAAGPILIAIGSGLYIGAGLGPGPRDGLMTALAKRGVVVSVARTAIEATVLVAGVLLGGTVGIGTFWFAFGIGPMVGYTLPRLTLPAAESSSTPPGNTIAS